VPSETVSQGGFDIAAKFRAVGLVQPMGMALVPAESPADKQPLSAGGHASAAHDIAGQSAQVTAVAQYGPSLPQSYRAKGQKRQCAANAQ
tara:strand:- start:7767 stop:8036 length:270 start_codon:yes stop_codon:yes gene_type:complete